MWLGGKNVKQGNSHFDKTENIAKVLTNIEAYFSKGLSTSQ